MHTKIFSATTLGIEAKLIDVEIDLAYGLVQWNIVGLPDIAIKESKQRIQAALKNCGLRIPDRKITVNLAPADIKKEGTMFDVPIALGILEAAEHIVLDRIFRNETIFLGELSLDGAIKPVRGVLAIASEMQKLNKKRLVVPASNAVEASVIPGIEVIPVEHLLQLVAFLRKEQAIAATTFPDFNTKRNATLDFCHVRGQRVAKRACQIAAAGRHNLIFIGSPGSGKTMLAERLPSIMPDMSHEEIIETTKIYSISGKLDAQKSLITTRPFRNPHHTTSQAGLVGGGSIPQPGEISLAHNGILFLDELLEFKRSVLEVLRQPLEGKTISLARAQQTLTFPAAFLLVAALNPCPCGYFGDKKRQCACAPQTVHTYLQKLSGPLLDRIDIQVAVSSIGTEVFNTEVVEESSASLYEGVLKALSMQQKRFGANHIYNSSLKSEDIEIHCTRSLEAQQLIEQAFTNLNLSMRGYHKLLKLARTIADIDFVDVIEKKHVQEALMYRSLDSVLGKR